MSIMIIYGNNKNASVLTDCRATYRMKDGSTQYYERMCKVRKFNKTIIGIIGDGDYANKIYDSIKNNNFFSSRKEFINAKFEDLYELCLMYSKQYKNDFNGLGCMIAIAGINKNNQIMLDYFHTSDYIHHTVIPADSNYVSKVFCNNNEAEIDQKANKIANTTKENLIPSELHNMISEDVVPTDNTVNRNYSFEAISIE